jgi:lysylphosphatidylglycerol synthetase-like protein (DUF2156 family)
MKEQKYGSWAFIIGVALALILGLFGNYITLDIQAWISYLLVIIGLIVGFYNMGQKEDFNFLIVAIALLTVGAAGLQTIPIVGDIVKPILTYIVAFVAPAALIMALKALYDLSYKK